MPNYEPLIEQITEQTGVTFRPASPFELSKLEALGLPQPVIDFYGAFEPTERAGEEFRLLSDLLEGLLSMTEANWRELSEELAERLSAVMGDRPLR